MAVRDDLIEAFNTCIDRRNQGEAVEVILNDFPALASQLRPMLETGLLFARSRIPAVEVEAAETAGEAVIRQAAREVFRGGLGSIWILLLLIGGAAILLAVVIGSGGSQPALLVPETAVPTATTTRTPLPTISMTPTPTQTATAAPDLSRVVVIQGPVSAVEGSVMTIYNFIIRFDPAVPLLSAVRTGDVVRIEGISEAGVIQAATIAFVNVTVVVREGQVWRGDDCAVAPPEWARAQASGWYRLCASVPAGGSAGSSGSYETNTGGAGGSADDDDDDD